MQNFKPGRATEQALTDSRAEDGIRARAPNLGGVVLSV